MVYGMVTGTILHSHTCITHMLTKVSRSQRAHAHNELTQCKLQQSLYWLCMDLVEEKDAEKIISCCQHIVLLYLVLFLNVNDIVALQASI